MVRLCKISVWGSTRPQIRRPTCCRPTPITQTVYNYLEIRHHEWSNCVAQKIQTLFVDDIDGSEAEGTVRFGLEGTDYEIDLSVPHREELDKALATYIAHARKVGGTRRTARNGRRSASTIDTHKVREWAKEQGIEIKERGRVSANVVEK